MLDSDFPADTFGDRFALEDLPLPRLAAGYAVQMLGTDQLFDRASRQFLPVRSPGLCCLFDHFDEAFSAAKQWIESNGQSPLEHRLAIVPAGFDQALERHVLIYGVLDECPKTPKYIE